MPNQPKTPTKPNANSPTSLEEYDHVLSEQDANDVKVYLTELKAIISPPRNAASCGCLGPARAWSPAKEGHMHNTPESTSPNLANRPALKSALMRACIDACVKCEAACSACSAACLLENDVDALRECIRLDIDCADVCSNTARVLTARSFESSTEVIRAQVELCARACSACEKECRKHAESMEHCRHCAYACNVCEAACRAVDVGYAVQV
jgi:Domain of Unknown Function (DUF326)